MLKNAFRCIKKVNKKIWANSKFSWHAEGTEVAGYKASPFLLSEAGEESQT